MIDECKNEIEKIKNKYTSNDDMLKEIITGLKESLILSRLHDSDYKFETLLVMHYIKILLASNDKSDIFFTEFLEMLYFESNQDKKIVNKIKQKYLSNIKMKNFFEDLYDIVKI